MRHFDIEMNNLKKKLLDMAEIVQEMILKEEDIISLEMIVIIFQYLVEKYM